MNKDSEDNLKRSHHTGTLWILDPRSGKNSSRIPYPGGKAPDPWSATLLGITVIYDGMRSITFFYLQIFLDWHRTKYNWYGKIAVKNSFAENFFVKKQNISSEVQLFFHHCYLLDELTSKKCDFQLRSCIIITQALLKVNLILRAKDCRWVKCV
jgi:hypothetical protein